MLHKSNSSIAIAHQKPNLDKAGALLTYTALALVLVLSSQQAQAKAKPKAPKAVATAPMAMPSTLNAPAPMGPTDMRISQKDLSDPLTKASDHTHAKPHDPDCDHGQVSARNLPQDAPEAIRANARPGQCFSRLLSPPVVERVPDRVLVKAEHQETRVIPAVKAWRDQRVLVSPARTEYRTIAAVTRTVIDDVVVSPETVREEIIPAEFAMQTERVLVRPAHQAWVEQRGIPTGATLLTPQTYQPVRYRADGTLTWPGKDGYQVVSNEATRDYLREGSGQTIYCLIEVPAQYQDQTRRVMVRPEQRRQIRVPAVIKQVEREVVDVPEHQQAYEVEAVYAMKKVMVEVEPARSETITHPAIYKDVTRQNIKRGAEPVWLEVLCERNANPALVRDVQKALKARGYFQGPVTGTLGQQTIQAMQKFQADQGLAQGQVSMESVRALGIKL